MRNRFPIYIISKGRWDSRLTVKTLEYMKMDYFIVIEEQEYGEYSKVIQKERILILDQKFQLEYNTCDCLSDSKSKGPGPARNFVWEHAIQNRSEWHWVLDDNIRWFYRLNQNKKLKCINASPFYWMEEFVLKYSNIGMAGPNYAAFVPAKCKRKAYLINTRIYSCNLIRNDIPFRWRGRYNEDTDLSLNIIKSGLCTVLFNAFLQGKQRTQTLKGGNSDEFYSKEGTLPKSKMQVMLHPDCSKLKIKYGRWHHWVDYKKFQNVKLIPNGTSQNKN